MLVTRIYCECDFNETVYCAVSLAKNRRKQSKRQIFKDVIICALHASIDLFSFLLGCILLQNELLLDGVVVVVAPASLPPDGDRKRR